MNTFGLSADVALAVKSNVAIIEVLNREVERLEARLLESVRLRPQYALLKSIPGIGEVLAIAIMLETGDIGRFAQVGNFASYARCVDSTRYSNGKKKGEGNTRNGNTYLVSAFIERPTSPGVSVTRPDASLTRRKPKPTAWWPPRHWHTSSRGRATTF